MIAMVASVAFITGLRVHLRNVRKRFIANELTNYIEVVRKIQEKDALLSDVYHHFPTGRSGADLALAKTNSDGSLIVWFHGEDGHPSRHGHIYYSGSQLVQVQGREDTYSLPDHPEEWLHRLTNEWYEF
ncbi:MAG: hypothetical protein JWO95_2849 [Verrucomicrobiales bacterium]|nr:hypothetical protein [Verrucomicrobiales bacterium]